MREARQHRTPAGPHNRSEGGPVLIFGIHAVEAALANPKRAISRIHLTENAARRLHAILEVRQFVYERILPRDLDRRLGPDTVHQGALLETEPLPEPSLEELAEGSAGRPLLVLDQVTDPHNVGAILRSAAAFGTGGLVLTRRHSPPLGGTLAKSASGALEHVPVALVQNLSRALVKLKSLHFTVIGLDEEAPQRLEELDWPARSVLVLGAEGKGLRQLTRELCDVRCRISASGPLVSLNVSNAAAITLHWAALRRAGGGPQT